MRRFFTPIALATLFLLAAGLRILLEGNTDVAWLLTAGERMLDGERLYFDILETNPPIAVLIYLPAIFLERATGISATFAVNALTLLGIGLSLAITAMILKPSALLRGVDGGILLASAAAILAVMPMREFGQREHIAIIALLPWLALAARRAAGERPPLWAIGSAGAGLALTLMFKPQLALGVAFAVLALAFLAASWRPILHPENLLAALLTGLYGAATALVFPGFFEVIVPLARDVYVPVRRDWLVMLTRPAIAIWLGIGILLARETRRDPAVLLLIAASFGFALAYLLQQKGWPYHSYPMLALAFLALAVSWASAAKSLAPSPLRHAPMRVVTAMVSLAAVLWFNQIFSARHLAEQVAQISARPTILALTDEAGIGHPLVRSVQGIWVSRQQALWVATHAAYLQNRNPGDAERNARLAAYAARERAMLIADIKKRPPTIVLVDKRSSWEALLAGDAELKALLAPLQFVSSVDGVDIFRRPI